MADLTIEDLDALDGLYAKATPAQWAVRPMLADDSLPYDCIISHGAGNVTVASEIDEDTADAQSIAALHNAWPAVSAMLRRALAPPVMLIDTTDWTPSQMASLSDDVGPIIRFVEPPAAVPGLVFSAGYGATKWRVTETDADGQSYSYGPSASQPGRWVWGCEIDGPAAEYVDTEDECIAAATAHNAARLKGGES